MYNMPMYVKSVLGASIGPYVVYVSLCLSSDNLSYLIALYSVYVYMCLSDLMISTPSVKVLMYSVCMLYTLFRMIIN